MLDVEVVDVIARVALEEPVLIQQTEGQPFEALEESLDVLFAGRPGGLVIYHPVEDIPAVHDFLLVHFLVVAPNTGLDEVNLHLHRVLVLNGEPDVALAV